ncbi:hypothetical protein [Rothia sp. P4278]|uniref:hypothetical protein n=1 Tax=Rothia sp. P4278 TaxID=3402658 RepID=UPI003AEAA1CC
MDGALRTWASGTIFGGVTPSLGNSARKLGENSLKAANPIVDQLFALNPLPSLAINNSSVHKVAGYTSDRIIDFSTGAGNYLIGYGGEFSGKDMVIKGLENMAGGASTHAGQVGANTSIGSGGEGSH